MVIPANITISSTLFFLATLYTHYFCKERQIDTGGGENPDDDDTDNTPPPDDEPPGGNFFIFSN